jgi:hypothetical protein
MTDEGPGLRERNLTEHEVERYVIVLIWVPSHEEDDIQWNELKLILENYNCIVALVLHIVVKTVHILHLTVAVCSQFYI